MPKTMLLMTGISETQARTARMWTDMVDVVTNITKGYAMMIAQDAPRKHASNPHPSGLWTSKGKKLPMRTWNVADLSSKSRRNYYAAFTVKAGGGAYGKAASYAEYYTADKARVKKGKVLARELDKAFGMVSGKANGRVAWRIYDDNLPKFDRDIAFALQDIERIYKEV